MTWTKLAVAEAEMKPAANAARGRLRSPHKMAATSAISRHGDAHHKALFFKNCISTNYTLMQHLGRGACALSPVFLSCAFFGGVRLSVHNIIG